MEGLAIWCLRDGHGGGLPHVYNGYTYIYIYTYVYIPIYYQYIYIYIYISIGAYIYIYLLVVIGSAFSVPDNTPKRRQLLPTVLPLLPRDRHGCCRRLARQAGSTAVFFFSKKQESGHALNTSDVNPVTKGKCLWLQGSEPYPPNVPWLPGSLGL